MFKRKGIYYYVYTLSGNQNYVNAYMMSRESPLSVFQNLKATIYSYSLLLKTTSGDRGTETCSIMKLQTIISLYIWNMEKVVQPVRFLPIACNSMQTEPSRLLFPTATE